MKLVSLKIKWFKNLNFWEKPIDFTKSEWISIFVWNNWSWKSNVLEAISAIFYGLYNKKDFDTSFEFELIYKIKLNSYLSTEKWETIIFWEWQKLVVSSNEIIFEVKHENSFLSFYINWKNISLNHEQINFYLPSQIIALYSWEEIRLYEDYYKNGFQDYISSIISNSKSLEYPKMNFLDKDFWNIAILTLFISVFNFDESDNLYKWLEKILWKWISLKKIYFDINEENLEKFKQNKVTNFVNILKGINNISIEKLIELNNDTWILWSREDFFKNLHIACNQKDLKNCLIFSIDIELNNWVNTNWLSEWQKKQILIYLVTQILADKDSIVLLDEPDSYIHVWNKDKLEFFFKDFIYSNEQDKSKHIEDNREWEIIMTTHSPTLMNKFDKKHLFYLENGKLFDKNQAEILKEISWDTMSYAEQQIILNTNKDILLVEWKLDIIFIETALNIINEEKYNLIKENLVFIPTWWASGLRLFIDKFTPKENQKIIWLLDNDKAWKDEIKEILKENYEKELIKDWFIKINELTNTFLLKLPKLSHINDEQYEIEDYFPLNKMIDIAKNQIDTFKVLKNFSLKKDIIKKMLSKECKNFDKPDFENFKILFDLILEIKSK